MLINASETKGIRYGTQTLIRACVCACVRSCVCVCVCVVPTVQPILIIAYCVGVWVRMCVMQVLPVSCCYCRFSHELSQRRCRLFRILYSCIFISEFTLD